MKIGVSRSRPRPPGIGPRDKDWQDAGRLMREHQIPSEDHTIFQENLATYLSHRKGEEPSLRWQNKIKRELTTPYTDQQVYQQLDTLEDSLQANLRELPSMPSKLYITGSFAKGRLGGNSDIDGFAVMKEQEISAGFDSYVAREKEGTAANLFPLSENSPGYNKGHLLFAGQSATFTPDQIMQDGFLREAYDHIRGNRSGKRRETTAVFEKITSKLWGEEKSAEDKREAFESQSLRTRLQNGIMSLGGTLSMTPLVGPAVMAVCDMFATQRHSDMRDFPQQDKDWNDAGAMMKERGIPASGHSVLQENLATYLAHRGKDGKMPEGRFSQQLEAELANPYTDQEVYERVDQLQDSLLENLAELPTYPGKVYITGSFSKGRLSAQDDLNGYVPVSKENFNPSFQVFGKRQEAGANGANLFPMAESDQSFNKGMMMVEGTSVVLNTEDLKEGGYLRQIYREVLSDKPADRKESRPALEGPTGKMWRSKFERDPLHFKAMRGAVAVVGALSSLPVVGSLVERLAGSVVRQDHKDLS